MRLFLLTLALLSSNVMGEWSSSYIKDEMRGTQKEMTDIMASPVNGDGPDLYILITKESDTKSNITFNLSNTHHSFDCKDSCEISMRFDDFEVVKQKFLMFEPEKFITPSAPLSLIRAMSLADTIFIEIPMTDGSHYQYKLNKLTLQSPIEPNPKLTIFNLEIGADESTLPASFTPSKAENHYTAKDVPLADGYFKVSHVSVNIAKGKIASFIFETSDKKQKKALDRYLTKAFGSKSELVPNFTTWPDNKYNINYNTVSASMLGNTYILSDDSLDNFK